MAYQCPRCGQNVERASSPGAAVAGGLVGALIYGAFGSFRCCQCGPIAKEEFPPEVQSKMTAGSAGMIAVAVVIFVIACFILVAINSMP
ncbi:MAG: hypothetical protein L0211_08965 [Planctomycetaceae bacterium]|nr:hypothetical protein [Planctomycetaceae bacterium]